MPVLFFFLFSITAHRFESSIYFFLLFFFLYIVNSIDREKSRWRTLLANKSWRKKERKTNNNNNNSGSNFEWEPLSPTDFKWHLLISFSQHHSTGPPPPLSLFSLYFAFSFPSYWLQECIFKISLCDTCVVCGEVAWHRRHILILATLVFVARARFPFLFLGTQMNIEHASNSPSTYSYW